MSSRRANYVKFLGVTEIGIYEMIKKYRYFRNTTAKSS